MTVRKYQFNIAKYLLNIFLLTLALGIKDKL